MANNHTKDKQMRRPVVDTHARTRSKRELNETLKELLRELQNKEAKKIRKDLSDEVKTLVANWEQLKSSQETRKAQSERDAPTPSRVGSWKTNEAGGIMMHVGQNIWIPNEKYNEIALHSTSNQTFVKKMALAISSPDTAVSCANNADNGGMNPTADSSKAIALREIFAHYLRNYLFCSDSQVKKELDKLADYLNAKSNQSMCLPAKKDNCLPNKSSQKAITVETKRRKKYNTGKNITRKESRNSSSESSSDTPTLSEISSSSASSCESDDSSVSPTK